MSAVRVLYIVSWKGRQRIGTCKNCSPLFSWWLFLVLQLSSRSALLSVIIMGLHANNYTPLCMEVWGIGQVRWTGGQVGLSWHSLVSTWFLTYLLFAADLPCASTSCSFHQMDNILHHWERFVKSSLKCQSSPRPPLSLSRARGLVWGTRRRLSFQASIKGKVIEYRLQRIFHFAELFDEPGGKGAVEVRHWFLHVWYRFPKCC